MKKELFGPFERHFCKSRSIQQWKMLCFTLTFTLTLVLLSYSYYNLRAFLIIMSKLKFCGIVAFPPPQNILQNGVSQIPCLSRGGGGIKLSRYLGRTRIRVENENLSFHLVVKFYLLFIFFSCQYLSRF